MPCLNIELKVEGNFKRVVKKLEHIEQRKIYLQTGLFLRGSASFQSTVQNNHLIFPIANSI